MNPNQLSRRTFVGLGIASPLSLSLGSINEVSESLLIDRNVDAILHITAHRSEKAAEKWRRQFAIRPFEGVGEWYLQSADELELPANLAEMSGTLTNYDYVIGVAAAEASVLVGAFRREQIGLGFRMRGGEHYAHKLAEFFASQPLPDQFSLLWNPTRLRAFLPTTERLGLDVEPSDAFWP